MIFISLYDDMFPLRKQPEPEALWHHLVRRPLIGRVFEETFSGFIKDCLRV
jgi:hypothetical protein